MILKLDIFEKDLFDIFEIMDSSNQILQNVRLLNMMRKKRKNFDMDMNLAS